MVITSSEVLCGQYNKAIAVFMMINIVLIAIINITVLTLSSNGYGQNEDIKMCLPCECLGLHPGYQIVGIEVVENNGLRCCASNIRYLKTLIDLYADNWIRKKHTQECSHSGHNDKDTKPVIKLVGLTYRHMGQNDLMVWAEEHPFWIRSNDIGYDHGFIEIKRSGYYQVYNQVTFEKDESWRGKETMKNESTFFYKHCVILIRIDRISYINVMERTILGRSFNAKTCRSGWNDKNFTSFLDGIFYLEDGDKLGVKVSNLDYVKPQPHMTFFGAHMI